METKEFRLQISKEEIDDLLSRLKNARFPPDAPEFNPDTENRWSRATPLPELKTVIKEWEGFLQDWKSVHEPKFNSFPQFKSKVNYKFFGKDQAVKIHYIHQKCADRSKKKMIIPLLLIHGWPGSIHEFNYVIPMLNDSTSDIGFDIVAPSLPGYLYSDYPSHHGCDNSVVADIFQQLMSGLGYKTYVAQGGDWGSTISRLIGLKYPESCKAIHVNMIVAPKPKGAKPESGVHLGKRSDYATFAVEAFGYQRIQGTKPQSLAYGLSDSPVGLLGWLLEKFVAWSDSDSVLPKQMFNSLKMHDFLMNLSLYYFSNSIGTSMRIYYETLGSGNSAPGSRGGPGAQYLRKKVTVPVAAFLCPYEPMNSSREWAEQILNIQRWTEASKGGHFAALECPEELTKDMISFFRQVYSSSSPSKL